MHEPPHFPYSTATHHQIPHTRPVQSSTKPIEENHQLQNFSKSLHVHEPPHFPYSTATHHQIPHTRPVQSSTKPIEENHQLEIFLSPFMCMSRPTFHILQPPTTKYQTLDLFNLPPNQLKKNTNLKFFQVPSCAWAALLTTFYSHHHQTQHTRPVSSSREPLRFLLICRY